MVERIVILCAKDLCNYAATMHSTRCHVETDCHPERVLCAKDLCNYALYPMSFRTALKRGEEPAVLIATANANSLFTAQRQEMSVVEENGVIPNARAFR
jgi:hypothetical protein